MLWSGTLALLRTSVEVLKTEPDPLKIAQEKWWATVNSQKSRHSIFWDFIREDRNVLLHLGVSNAGQSVTVSGVILREGGETPPPSIIYEYEIRTGPFAGKDPRELLGMAISWVEEQLDWIEAAAVIPATTATRPARCNPAYVRAMKSAIINDLFVRTADENYITARWCATNGLAIDFFWLAVHSLEKYMKAVLLKNGRPALKQQHKIVELHDEVSRFAGELLPVNLEQPAGINLPFWPARTLRQFLEHVYRNGQADNRYLIFGFVQHYGDLQMLDQAVFAYRRMICSLDDRMFPDHVPNAPTLTHRDHLENDPRYFSPVGSSLPLDRLIMSRDETPLRRAALDLNFPFAPTGYSHPPMTGFSASHNAVLVRHVLEPLESDSIDQAAQGMKVADWTLQNVRLPLDVTAHIKGAMRAAKIRHPSLR